MFFPSGIFPSGCRTLFNIPYYADLLGQNLSFCLFGNAFILPLLLKDFFFAQATITKYHRLNGLNNRNLFSHSSRGQKFKILVPLWLVSDQDCLACTWLYLTWHRKESKHPAVSFYKGTNPIIRTPHHDPSNPNYLPKSLSPNISYLGLRVQSMNLTGQGDSECYGYSVHNDLFIGYRILD